MIRFKTYLIESEAKIQMIAAKQGDKVWRTYMDNHESYQYDYKNGEEIIREFDYNNEKYTQWFVNEYIKKNFLLKELEEVGSKVAMFDKHKAKLQYQDINKYSYLELETEILNIPNAMSKKQLDMIDHELIKNKEAEVFAKEHGFLVIMLHSEKASCFYGRGTEWCTAATDLDSEGRKKNKFDFYTKDGEHLYVVFTPDNKKFQILISKYTDFTEINDVIQIADIHDEYINYEKFLSLYPTFEPIFKKIARKENNLLFMSYDELVSDDVHPYMGKDTFIKIARTFRHNKITTDNLIDFVARIKKWSEDTKQYQSFIEIAMMCLYEARFNYISYVSDETPANFIKFIQSFVPDDVEHIYITDIIRLLTFHYKYGITTTSRYIKYYLMNSTIFSNEDRLTDVLYDWKDYISYFDLDIILKKSKINQNLLYTFFKSLVKFTTVRSGTNRIEQLNVIFNLLNGYNAHRAVEYTKKNSRDEGIDKAVEKWYDEKYKGKTEDEISSDK